MPRQSAVLLRALAHGRKVRLDDLVQHGFFALSTRVAVTALVGALRNASMCGMTHARG